MEDTSSIQDWPSSSIHTLDTAMKQITSEMQEYIIGWYSTVAALFNALFIKKMKLAWRRVRVV